MGHDDGVRGLKAIQTILEILAMLKYLPHGRKPIGYMDQNLGSDCKYSAVVGWETELFARTLEC